MVLDGGRSIGWGRFVRVIGDPARHEPPPECKFLGNDLERVLRSIAEEQLGVEHLSGELPTFERKDLAILLNSVLGLVGCIQKQ